MNGRKMKGFAGGNHGHASFRALDLQHVTAMQAIYSIFQVSITNTPEFGADQRMGECNTILSAYTLYRHLE